jgi:flavin reductase (DIM6/NTAB) family NADH-FMN oxidoreductase RutF
MTANLLTQVCIEPKLVGVAVQADSVTAGLIDQGQAFTVSMLARDDKDIVRRFVKPVPADQVERADDGTVTTMVGHAVLEVGEQKLPVLAAAAGYLLCQLTEQRPLGSHKFCIGEVIDVGGEPSEVLRMEDTRMHYGG